MNFTYAPLSITAPEELWRTLGFAINTDGKLSLSHLMGMGPQPILSSLATAYAELGNADGPRTVARAIQEMQRLREELARTEASRQEAAAATKLAEAISGAAASVSVDAILDRLNEHTKYAVIAQLRSSGNGR